MTTEQGQEPLRLWQQSGFDVPNEDDVANIVQFYELSREDLLRKIKDLAPTGRFNGLDIYEWQKKALALTAERDALKAELAELKAGERVNIDYQRSLEDQLAALRAQASPDAVDARRYRWLRKADSPVGKLCIDDGLLFAGPALDAAIDAAIAAIQREGK